ncbi:MAG: nucleoside-triphosphatase [bacterium]|nr:nucleoside-triphosphatase [bacterium]
MLFLLTGPINSGKSSAVAQIAQRLREEKLAIGGIVSMPILENGIKKGFDALCLSTRKTKLLARLKTLVPNSTLADLAIGQWIIFDNGIRFCNQQIEEARQKNPQVIIIDEIGPLEIQGKGFRLVLDKILLGEQKIPFHLLVVVRKSLVEEVRLLYPNREFTLFNLQENLIDVILRKVR